MVFFDQVFSHRSPVHWTIGNAAHMVSPAIQDDYKSHANNDCFRIDCLELFHIERAVSPPDGAIDGVGAVLTRI